MWLCISCCSYGYTSPSYTVLSPSGPPRARWGSTGVSRESYKGRQSALTEKDMEYLREHDEQSNQVWETWRQRKTLELQLAKEEQHK